MSNQGNPRCVAVLTKLLRGKSMNSTGLNTNPALVNSPAIDVAHEPIRAPLLC